MKRSNLPGEVLTRAEVEDLFRDHNEGGHPDRHVFCALHRVGLLGHVHLDRVRGQWAQRFLRPGEATLEPDGVLPRASHYLVHPVLSDVIGHVNPGYFARIDRVNIVGYGRPWHEAESPAARALRVPLTPDPMKIYGAGDPRHMRDALARMRQA